VNASAPRRRRRWLLVVGLAGLLFLGGAIVALRVALNGPPLGATVAGILNQKMRGRIEIGTIEWPSADMTMIVTGGWLPITAHGVRVWDDCALSVGVDRTNPDSLRLGDPNTECAKDDQVPPGSGKKPRKLLLSTDKITAEIDVHALLFGNHDFVFRHLVVDGGEALIEQTTEPYPLHAYDRTIVSIVTAFYPRMKAGFRAGIYADAPPPIFELRDIHVAHLGLTAHMSPYGMSDPSRAGYTFTLRIEDVNMDAGAAPRDDSYLYFNATDPLIPKFYFHLALTGGHAAVRIFDEGPRSSFRIPDRPNDAVAAGGDARPTYPPPGRDEPWGTILLDDVELPRLAQLPTAWAARDFVAPTLEVDLRAHSHAGASLILAGELANYFEGPYDGRWNFTVDVKNLGPTLHELKHSLGGDDLSGRITLTGPYVAKPRVGLDLQNLDVAIPLSKTDPLQLTLAEVHGAIDLVNDQGFIEKTRAVVKARGGTRPSGEVDLSATFGVKPTFANAAIDIVKPIDLARFLGASQATLGATVGTYVSGSLHAVGDLNTSFGLQDLNLWLGRTPSEHTTHIHHGAIIATDYFDQVTIRPDADDRPLTINAGQTRAELSGKIVPREQTLDLRVQFESPDLATWLARLEAPAIATSARNGVLRIRGPFTRPRLEDGRVDLGGVPTIDALSLDQVGLAGGVLDVGRIASTGLGGTLGGDAQVRLGGGAFVEHLRLAGANLNAAKLPGLGAIATGTIDRVDLALHGPVAGRRAAIDWLDLVTATVRADHLALRGDGYSDVALCVNRPDDGRACRPRGDRGDDVATCADARHRGGACAVATATRDAGGTLDLTLAKVPPVAGRGPDGKPREPGAHLAGSFTLADLPLSILTRLGLVGPDVVGGELSTSLRLGGRPTAPSATGPLTLLRGWAMGAFLGDSQLAVEPTTLTGGAAGLALRGTALGGRVALRATLGTAAPFPLEVELSARRLELDPFVDLGKLAGLPDAIRGWASGRITLRTELAPRGAPHPEAWVELDELVAVVDHRAADGRLTPLRFAAVDQSLGNSAAGDGGGGASGGANGPRPAVSLHVTRDSLALACRVPGAPGGQVPCSAALATPAGVITLAGSASAKEIGLSATGALDLALIAPLLDAYFDDASGRLIIDGAIGGTLAAPTYEAGIQLDDVRLRPVGQETVVRAPTGLVKLANGSLGFTQVRLRVDDTYLGEAAELVIGGGVRLHGLTPVSWGVLIDGKLAGKMLLAAAPKDVSQATGVATIDETITLSGNGPRPTIAGALRFDRAAPLIIIPRAVRRELTLLGGTISVDTSFASGQPVYEVTLDDLAGSIDGEGSLHKIRGTIDLKGAQVADADVTLDADNLPFRIPGTLDLNVSGSNLHILLASPTEPLELEGNVTIVNGTYQRNFDLAAAVTPQAPTGGPSVPFWETYPALGNASLNLGLDVRRFAIANNIMTVDMTGPNLEIRGTPRDPRLSGSIVVQRGEFRIPGSRAKFTRTSGSLDFSESQKFPSYTPTINVTSEADFRDPSGQDHIITALVTGTYANLQWDLHTSTGYNKAQTLSLLFLGQSPDQLRRSLGDQSLGADPTRQDPSTNPTAGPADQIVKDVAGQWVSLLLGDSLKEISGLDVLRFEIGFGSVGVHGEKKLLENLKFLGDYETTLRGSTINVRGEFRSPVKLGGSPITVQGGYLNKTFNSEAEQDVQDWQAKLVYRLFIP
jgi:hypothetical protein